MGVRVGVGVRVGDVRWVRGRRQARDAHPLELEQTASLHYYAGALSIGITGE